jgi:Mg-chelatase subunit ChlD
LHVTLEAWKPLDSNIIGQIITKDVFGWSIKPAKPIPEALAALKGVFRRARGKVRDISDEEGIEVDLDDYIQKKAGNKEAGVFRDEEMVPGLHVAILLDVSGSMSGRPLEIAKSILLTLHAALKETKTVKYSVYAFSGSGNSDYITPVVRLTPERMADIEATSYFPYTHTHHGVQYVTNILSRETGKKLLIILTDGMPEARGHANPIVYTSIAISKARKKGIIVFSIFVSQSYAVDRESLRKVFGPETTWAVVEDMQHAGKVLINVVSRQVLNNLLKR